MALVQINLADRDTKRWHTCLSCLIKELEAVEGAKPILDKFSAKIGSRDDGFLGLHLLFPENYQVPQELI
jgi:hypothetical protein